MAMSEIRRFINPMSEPPVIRPELPGLYLHVPFCKTKCPYCDFYSITDDSLVFAWLQALEKEIDLLNRKSVRCRSRAGTNILPAVGPGHDARAFGCSRFDTFYLGGGTPSCLGQDEISAVFDLIRQGFVFTKDAEITLEANPDDVTADRLHLWGRLGVNRLSLGVQSLLDAELRFLSRRHDALQARQALSLAREAGFENLGVDLMYGLPGQTKDNWLATLDGILVFQPEHLSCYQLTIEENTPLAAKRAQGLIKPLPEEQQRDFFLLTSQYLEEQGYLHYEVSNFARNEPCISRHNSKYWRHSPYLGLGPAAHSFDGRLRFWNYRSVAEYCQALAAGKPPVDGREELTVEQRRLEAIYLGLRTKNGALLTFFTSLEAEAALSGLCRAGLVRVYQGRVLPTRQGFLVADSLALLLSS
ncbi:MAG TPA: coproporphyrinogen III oxidase [Desulfobacterales bacterium]|nr:coproporphyrinogen III oxidase [Desulfobacterales bacterium]